MNLETLIAVVSLRLGFQTVQEHFYLYLQACNQEKSIQRRAPLERFPHADKRVDLDNQPK